MTRAFLDAQSRIAVGGPEAADFLQGLITTDLETLGEGEASAGALLTPQGKIFFFFLISRDGGGFSFEISSDQAEAFAKRLVMYRLRAKVDIGAVRSGGTTVIWDEDAPQGALRDKRFEKAGIALYRLTVESEASDRAAYDALRTAAGVPEPGFDFALSDAFPHDVLMDKSGGVSFKKGCYVGQEVVSRMQHRSTARRRLVTVEAEAPLPPNGTEILANGKPIGALGTVTGQSGLAIVRVDKAGSVMNSGEAIVADGVPVTLRLPAWSGLEFPSTAGED